MKKKVRIFIADDHRLMLDGLASLISSIEGFELTGKFASGTELLKALESAKLRPDICIVDIEMPGMDGVETVRRIRQHDPSQKVLALTMHNEWHFVNRMVAAGANGYILKNVERDVFIQTIERIIDGSTFVTEGMNVTRPTDGVELSEREAEILRKIVQGKSNKEIGDELFISARTVDTHRTNIKRKLKMTTLSQLIQYAKERGLS